MDKLNAVSALSHEHETNQLAHFGPGIVLQLKVDGVPIRIETVSVGCLPEKCLFIKKPTISAMSGISVEWSLGRDVVVRYRVGEDMFGFRSRVIGATNEPIKLLFLDYPNFVARCDLRNAPRMQAYIPARLVVTRFGFSDLIPGAIMEGTIRDISRSGCRFSLASSQASAPSMRINDKALLRVQLPGMEESIDIAGEMKRIEQNGQETTVGIRFLKRNVKAHQDLISFMVQFEKSGKLDF